jgi:hypothetical protein
MSSNYDLLTADGLTSFDYQLINSIYDCSSRSNLFFMPNPGPIVLCSMKGRKMPDHLIGRLTNRPPSIADAKKRVFSVLCVSVPDW